MRRLVDGQSTKRPQLHDSGEFRVDLLQAIERTIEREDGYLGRCRDLFRFLDRHAGDAIASLPGTAPAGVIDQDPAHRLRGDAKEVCLTVPIDLMLVDKPQVHLVDKRRWLQRVVGPFAPKLAGGYATELRIDEWQQLIERTLIASTPLTQ